MLNKRIYIKGSQNTFSGPLRNGIVLCCRENSLYGEGNEVVGIMDISNVNNCM